MKVLGGGSGFAVIRGVLYAAILIVLMGILVALLFSITERVFPGTIARVTAFASNLFDPSHAGSTKDVLPETTEDAGNPEPQYDRSNYFYRSELVEENLQKLAQSDEKAALMDREAAPGRKVAVHIDGMLEAEVMEQILRVVERHETKVSFFISGMQAVDAPDVVKAIADAGFEVGNYTLYAGKNLQNQAPEDLVEDFTVAGEILRQASGNTPTRLKANASVYTDGMLEAAHASGIEGVVQSTTFLTYQSFKSYEEVQTYLSRRTYGDILSVKLSGELDASEYTPKEIVEQPAIDKQESAVVQETATETLTEVERVVRLVDWLLTAIDDNDFDPQTVALREDNAGMRAQIVNDGHLLTTEPAVGYQFYGLGRQAELDGILHALHELSGVGTFYVSADEINEYPDQIDQVIRAGHSVGIVHYPVKNEDFYTVLNRLVQARSLLEARGATVKTVLQPWNTLSDALQEAASAIGLEVYTSNVRIAREENQKDRDPQQVVQELPYGFKRGELVAFRMNYFEREDMIGRVITALQGTYNAYEIKEASSLYHSELTFQYPLPEESILPEVKDMIYPGQLPDDFMAYAKDHYIGSTYVNGAKKLPGFSSQEISMLDKTGKLDYVNDIAFLTFDDWGTDVPITKLLEVLRKHNVKATFFVVTQFVDRNPQLLRAIALEGHSIASHTNTHMQMASADQYGAYNEITDEQAELLRLDIQKSYEILQSIVGDIRHENNKPALSRLFRPPTLAVSRKGMEAAFDVGMAYIIDGDYAPNDYEEESTEVLLRNMRLNIRNGSIAVMHFSDSAKHTADAVDQYLTMNETNQNRKRYAFARLSDYLGD